MELTNQANWKKGITLLLIGQSLTIFASLLAWYAILWYVAIVSQSGLAMTMLTVAKAVPLFLVSPFAGVWADRYCKKTLIIISDSFVAVITMLVAIVFAIGYEYIVFLLLTNVARGIGQGILTPAYMSIIPAIVPKDNLVKVNGFSQSVQAISQTAAPAVAGLLMAFFPIYKVLLIDVATAIIGVLILVLFVRINKVETETKNQSAFFQMKEGISYLKESELVKQIVFFSIVINLVLGPAIFFSTITDY